MLLQDYLINSAKQYPDKEAIIQSDSRTTYGEIYEAAQAVGNWLIDEEIQTGDRIAILTEDPVEYVFSYFGILLAGGTVVALNTQTSARTLEYIFNHCRITALVTQAKFSKYFQNSNNVFPALKTIAISGLKDSPINDVSFRSRDLTSLLKKFTRSNAYRKHTDSLSPSAIAQIIYTSGTTGKPKGVMLRHSNLMANARSIVKYLKLNPDERHMVVLPFFYSYGNSILISHFAVHAALVVHQNLVYPNSVFDIMNKENVTGFSGVPSTYAILLNRSSIRNHQFPHLSYLAQAGGAMSPKLAQELKTILPDVQIFIMYGQTEASARLSYLDPHKLLSKADSIGKAIPGVTLHLLNPDGTPVSVGETGEIVAQGDNIMAGYWEDPEGTASVLRKEGLWTGDLARMDDEGYLYIVSRKSELIKSGAHRIGPKEIEEVILEHESVHETAVFGIEDEILGEAIKACIVLKDHAPCTKKEMIIHCRQKLPAYKVPHHIEFLKQLPKTASGKIKKNELKHMLHRENP